MEPLTLTLVLLLTTLLGFIGASWLLDGREGKRRKDINIPPGSMGLPFLGETLPFVRIHRTTTLGEFLEGRIKKYGKISKTHILGEPAILSADTDLNHYVCINSGGLFEPTWPTSFQEILGKTWMEMQVGEIHRKVKNQIIGFVNLPRLRTHFFEHFEGYVVQCMDSWKEGVTFPAQKEACKVTFNLIVKNLLGMNPGEPKMEELRKGYLSFIRGFSSMPVNFPGFTYRKALQSRAAILKIIEKLTEERIQKKKEGKDEIGDDDFIGVVLEHLDLTPQQVSDLLLGLLFGGHETSTLAITTSLYFLKGCPKALQQLREEHLEIKRMKEKTGQTRVTWEDYRKMEFTHCVVSETLRLGNIIGVVGRKATKDIQFKGYTIPSGWTVYMLFAAGHLEGSVYDNPHQFDPWRWQKASTGARADNFMPFSQGLHKCAGGELARMEMAIFLHHLVLRYDWELMEMDHPVARFGFADFGKGLPIRVKAFNK